MRINWKIGIRLKFLMMFTLSIMLALISLTVIQSLLSEELSREFGDLQSFERKYSFYYVILFLLLTTAFFYIFSRHIIKRIEYINSCVNEIKKGNWDIRITAHTQDEIGNLGRQINGMVKCLKELKEKELAAEALKTEMIANISHDLRTPVTSLIGYVELIKSNLHDSEKSARYIEIAERKCQELKKQIEDLLEYCTISYQEHKLNKVKIDVKELLQQVMIDFVPQLEEADMNFQIHAPTFPVYTEADVGLFLRMLQNIIGNSIAYGFSGKQLDFYLETSENEAVLKIVNYGKEIPQADLPYIFEKFYRGEKSRNSDTGGKGMGLAISKSIAGMHGGNITVHSDPKATVFIISLPSSLIS